MIKINDNYDRNACLWIAGWYFCIPEMKFIAIPILILLVMTQTFSTWAVVMSFKLNRDYIAKNLCENRYRPQLNCKGNCVLMKKLKEKEKQEQNSSETIKLEIASLVLSSRVFFATIETPVSTVTASYSTASDSGKPVDRPITFFHPPSA